MCMKEVSYYGNSFVRNVLDTYTVRTQILNCCNTQISFSGTYVSGRNSYTHYFRHAIFKVWWSNTLIVISMTGQQELQCNTYLASAASTTDTQDSVPASSRWHYHGSRHCCTQVHYSSSVPWLYSVVVEPQSRAVNHTCTIIRIVFKILETRYWAHL